jgi:hypothetical protein
MFAAQMQDTFEHSLEERRLRHKPVLLRFLIPEFLCLLNGIAADWLAKWTTDPAVRGRCLPDVRMMRPPGITREVWFAAPGPTRLRQKHNIDESGRCS